MSRFRQALATTALVAASATALMTIPSALAAEANYSCGNCAHVSGPNQNPINANEAINYSGTGICSILWRYNGGSSYTEVKDECTEGRYYQYAYSNGNINGHGEVEHYFPYSYEMAGHQYVEP